MQRKFGYVLGAVLGRKSGQHGSNLAPKMEPKSAKNREKIDAKIDRKIDAFQDRFLMRFWWILGAKLEPSWDPNRRKMKVNFESPIFQKNIFFRWKNKVFQERKQLTHDTKVGKNRVIAEPETGSEMTI